MNTSLLPNAFVLLFALMASVAPMLAQATSSLYSGADNGQWNNPANWKPNVVPNNTGGTTFNVTIPSEDNVMLDIDATVSSFTAAGDIPVSDANIVSVDHNFTAARTTLGANGGLDFSANTKDVLASLGNLTDFSGTTLNNGYFLALIASAGHAARIRFQGANIVNNNAGPAFGGLGVTRFEDENGNDAFRNFNHNLPGGFIQVVFDGGHFTVAKAMTNEGTFLTFEGGTLTFASNYTGIGDLRDPNDQQGGFLVSISSSIVTPARIVVNGALTNYDATSKTLHFGRFNLEGSRDGVSTIQVFGGAPLDIVNNDASILLTGQASAILDLNGANALRNLAINHRLRMIDHDFTTAGSLTTSNSKFATLTTRGKSHLTISGDLKVMGGALEISPLGFQTDGIPKSSELKVNGALTLAAPARTHFEVFGPTATAVATVTGSANFGGTLEIFVAPNAPVLSGGSLTLLTAKTITGSFANVASGGRVLAYAISAFNDPLGTFDGVITGSFKTTYDNNSLVVSDFQPHASMLNISTRLKVGTGDNVGIAGFIVPGIGPKKLIVRGIGPSLTAKGVPGALQDPTLELRDSAGKTIMSNDNWQSDPMQAAAITATGIAPTDPRESAIIATLDPGMYTAVMSGVNNTTDIGLVEVYDLDDQPAASEFANISTRGRVGIGDNVMIGGIIVGPANPANVIVRATGPSLAAKGVAGPLQDPTLELHDGSGTKIMSNDNWQDDAAQASLIRGASLAPTDSRESALAVSLNPGNYTAIVRGKSDSQGVALVEFYKLN